MRRLLPLLWMLLAVLDTARAQVPGGDDDPSGDEALVLAVSLEDGPRRTRLTGAMLAYGSGDAVLLPLGELARLLELAIEVDPPGGRAEGFVLDRRRTFQLDARSPVVVVDGEPRSYDSTRLMLEPDDVYVPSELLSSWLPVDLDFDARTLMLVVRPRELLPAERRRQREAAARRVSLDPSGPSYPAVHVPYGWWDGPFVDLRVTTRSGESPTYAVHATGELLRLESELVVVGSGDDAVSRVRVRLGRTDPEGGLLGVGLREVSAGQVLFPGFDLVALPRAGIGARITSFPLHQPPQFDRHAFEGELPEGWEVELYRGETLLGYRRSEEDRRYLFEDVPLLFGVNEFRLVFHGPGGERREEGRTYDIVGGSTPRGRWYVHAVAGETDVYGSRALVQLSGGLASALGLRLGLASLEVGGDRRAYGLLGLNGFWRAAQASADLAMDPAGGRATRLALRGRAGSLAMSLEQAWLHDFASEVFRPSFGDPVTRTAARVEGRLPRPVARLPFAIELRRDAYESSRSIETLSGRLAAHRRGTSLTHVIAWRLDSGDGRSRLEPQATGNLLASQRFGTFAARGELRYELDPARRVTAMTATLERRVGIAYRVGARLQRDLETGDLRTGLEGGKQRGAFGLAVAAEHSEREGWKGSMSFSIGLAGRPGAWSAHSSSVSRTGAVQARVFLDRDDDGAFGAGDEPIEGVAFALNGRRRGGRSDEHGLFTVERLGAHRPVDVSIAALDVEDALWATVRRGVRVVPRPGKVATIDFPVVVTGEITGFVLREQEGARTVAIGVSLELVDVRGRVVLRGRSEYDGFYDLAGVPPGRYVLRVDPGALARGGLTAEERAIEIPPEGEILEGVDLVLRPSAP